MNKKLSFLVFLFVSLFCCSEISAQAKKKAAVKKVAPKGKAKATVVKKAASVSEPVLPAEKFARVKISTDFGDMVVKLYNKTPQHRDNFIKLVSEHFYDSLLFHRVISNFMIQGGDPNSKYAAQGAFLGNGDVGYKVPAEFDSSLFHKKGALCAARDGNPEKASSGCQFYIVQGKPVSEPELENISLRNEFKYTSAQRMTYKMNGGTPFLDNNYTVFGEVETGMEVIDKIAAVQKGAADRPVQDVRMKMEIVQAEEKAGKN